MDTYRGWLTKRDYKNTCTPTVNGCGFRLVSSCSGWHRQHSSSADILDKLWTSVIVEPLSKDELLQVIVLYTLRWSDALYTALVNANSADFVHFSQSQGSRMLCKFYVASDCVGDGSYLSHWSVCCPHYFSSNGEVS